jgi:pSer/pThr/pTyr-binding forkhead associated (FHA) protein
MAKRLLVIDRGDQGRFFLSLDSGTLTLGDSLTGADVVLRDLHVTRIHCEVEVAEDWVVVDNPGHDAVAAEGAPGIRQELHPGDALHVGHSHLRLEFVEAAAGADAPRLADDIPGLLPEALAETAEKPAPLATTGPVAPQAAVRYVLRVIDGADQGRFFPLPESGTVTIGKSHKHADIVLHDLYVARIHCELHVEGQRFLVKHVEGQSGTLINGQGIAEKALYPGEVLRVGNSHLRLETADLAAGPADNGTVRARPGSPKETVEDAGYEVLDEVAAAALGAARGAGEYCLPHSPVDELLQLEQQLLGHYQIGSLLGRGQSGLVFRAQDLKTKQTVALKVLAVDFPSNDAELQRFIRVLKTTAALAHPHLVTLYSAGKSGAYCWMAREFVDGECLTRRILRLQSAGKADWKSACRFGVQLARVLTFLHENKVTHGNITPRNVLIRSGDQMTKLVDLMLDRALEGSKLQKAIRDKKLLSELPFLAPEQTDPQAPVSPLGDIYSLGTVLYALLTGKPPFAGDSPKDVLAQVQSGKVVKPSRLLRGIPAALEAAVLMMMACRPEERLQTSAAALAALTPIAEQHGIEV